MQLLGECSICGGPVTLPTVWAGVIPPTPTCQSCGAVKAGPVIPMKPGPGKPRIEQIMTRKESEHD
jgi:hypothetical protein